MTFKIILTVLFATDTLLRVNRIGEEQKPIGIGEALIGLIITGIIIYGIWNWL